MDWKIDYWEKDGIVFVKVLNPVNLEGTVRICVEANALAKKHNAHRYLVDHRGVDVAMPIFDINEIPAKFKEVGADFNGETAILLDHSSRAEDRLDFLKNVLRLAAMHFELFYDEDKAVAWLKSV
jgi:hypothetical protein